MNDPRREWAGIAAAEVINLHLYSGEPATLIYSRLVNIIMAAMAAAEEERKCWRFEPSDN